MYSQAESIEFESYANPHAWFLVASELHEQAKLLKSSDSSNTKKVDQKTNEVTSWKNSNRATFLLAGFALENVIKAYLVYENPTVIENGFLANKIKSHDLVKLAKKSTLMPNLEKCIDTLKYFEDGLESWARYPCGLNYAQTKEQVLLDEDMWKNYLFLMKNYEKSLKLLLAQKWKGPHEFEASYLIEGNWLD